MEVLPLKGNNVTVRENIDLIKQKSSLRPT
jgi:hypothetical protein